jgi:hypothetical protein
MISLPFFDGTRGSSGHSFGGIFRSSFRGIVGIVDIVCGAARDLDLNQDSESFILFILLFFLCDEEISPPQP